MTPALPAGRAGLGLYPSLWRFSAGSRRTLLAAAALLIGSQSMRLVVPFFVGQAINALQQGGGASAWHASAWIGAVLATCALAWALHGPGRILEREVGVTVRRSVTRALFDRLAGAPLQWHDRHAASDLQQRMTQASGALDEFAQSQYVILQGVITFVGTLAALIVFSPAAGLVAVVAYVALAFVGRRFDRSLMRLAGAQNAAERRLGSGLMDFVGGFATVAALRLQPGLRRLVGDRLEAVFVPLRDSIRINEAKWCAIELLTTALTWGLVAFYVWRAEHLGTGVLIGSVFMIHQYADRAGTVVSTAAGHFQSLAHCRVNYASADPIWDAPARAEATTTAAADWRTVELHQVAYRHDASPIAAPSDTTPVGGIDRVSLTLRRGERVALVGPSGCGKSTLLRVIAGLYDATQGHASVDGIAHLGLKPVAALATFVPQDAAVFEGTVAENVAPGGDAGDPAIARALRISAFDEVLATMPQGLASPVAERGANLSGGQRQRLCLARGLVAARDSSLLLLDEPTSALDARTEARVLRELMRGFPDACIVASIHRTSLLEHFDRIVLMADGRVVDSGSVDALRERQPIFAALMEGDGGEREPIAAAA